MINRFAVVVVVVVVSGCLQPRMEPPFDPVNAANLAFTCDAHGLRAYDSSRSLVNASLACSVRAANRANAPVVGAKVTLLTEAGRLVSTRVTGSDGALAVRHDVSSPRPRDVAPEVFTATPVNDPIHTGAELVPAWMLPTEWREDPTGTGVPTRREPRRPEPLIIERDGRRTNNPRDNLVAMIVSVEGEESFVDTNGNGVLDPTESFEDLTEPFVDTDDDGTRGAEEPFIDTNGNRQWDGKNGVWDARTQVWKQQRVLWTGVPDVVDAQSLALGVPGHRRTVALPAPLTFVCDGPPCTRATAGSAMTTTLVMDPWFNAPTFVAGDTCRVFAPETLPVIITGPSLVRPFGAQETYDPSLTFQFFDSRTAAMPVPRRVPAVDFSAFIICTWSGADFVVNVVNGTIE